MTTEELLSRFGSYVNINDLKLDEQRSLTLNINNDKLLTINEISPTELFLNTPVCTMSEDMAHKCALSLLSQNIDLMNSSRGYLYWDKMTLTLCLAKKITTTDTTEVELDILIKNVMHDANTLINKLESNSIIK
ncbi:hypothetical protein D5952_14010 [Salmonella enterica subsp. enterica]|nr:hypothetical protein [Salmonella enterica subsp. enterica serovar Bonn]EBZ5939294.1 hypothetical protein [Salmonella enterica subsp. enterica serovar Muenchen]MLZ41038.1 hypothetical protein [Salmonella enterica subsp. enterica serovar Bonn]